LLLVLGDMLELGAAAGRAHAELGRSVASLAPSLLVLMGEQAGLVRQGALEAGLCARNCVVAAHHDEAAAAVEETLVAGDVVLVKGSRGMKMENVVRRLCDDGE
jgi:UDP-N-acetylmuramyl pentapeptide synthase